MSVITKIWKFYYDGFSTLSWWGKRAWLIIIIKLFVIFIILKIFFFHDFLGQKFGSEKDKGEYVMEQLINPPIKHD